MIIPTFCSERRQKDRACKEPARRWFLIDGRIEGRCRRHSTILLVMARLPNRWGKRAPKEFSWNDLVLMDVHEIGAGEA